MKMIAVMSPKGGIGKTTTSDSIAYILGEEQGKRVLVLDGDPQGDTSKTFGVYESEGIGMSELLEQHEVVDGTYRTIDLIQSTNYEYVDVITANGYLTQTASNLYVEERNDSNTRLQEVLKEVEDDYDYCVCDCGRLMDMVVMNALLAADLVIAPVKVGGYEVEALKYLKRELESLKGSHPTLKAKALMTMRQKNKTSLEVEEWLKEELGMEMFETSVARSIVAEKATIAMLPLPKFSRNSTTTKNYRSVVEELRKELEE